MLTKTAIALFLATCTVAIALPSRAESRETDIIYNPKWVEVPGTQPPASALNNFNSPIMIDVKGINYDATYIINMGLRRSVEFDLITPDAGYRRTQVTCQHPFKPSQRIQWLRTVRMGDFKEKTPEGHVPVLFRRTPELMGRSINPLERAIATMVCKLDETHRQSLTKKRLSN